MKIQIEWPAYIGEPGWEYDTITVSFYGEENKLELSRIKRNLKKKQSGDDVGGYCAYALGENVIPMWENIKTKVKIGYVTDNKLRQWIREAGMILAVPTSVNGEIVTFSVSKRIGGEKVVLDEIDRQLKALIAPSDRYKRLNMRIEFLNPIADTWHELEEYDRLKSEGRTVVYEFTLENDNLKIFNLRDSHVAFSIYYLLVDYKIVDYLESGYSCYAEIKSYKQNKCGIDIIFCVYVMY